MSEVKRKTINTKKGDQTNFFTLIGPYRSLIPSFGFGSPARSLLLIFIIKSSLENKILQIFWTDTHFHKMVPNSPKFIVRHKLGMKQGLEGQTRAQRHDDMKLAMVLSSVVPLPFLHRLVEYLFAFHCSLDQ
jgi:hypothetical protein